LSVCVTKAYDKCAGIHESYPDFVNKGIAPLPMFEKRRGAELSLIW